MGSGTGDEQPKPTPGELGHSPESSFSIQERYARAKAPAKSLLEIEKKIKTNFLPRKKTKARTSEYPLDFSMLGIVELNFADKQNPSDLDVTAATHASIVLTVDAASQLGDPFNRIDIAKDQELLVYLIKALGDGENILHSERIKNPEVVDKIIQEAIVAKKTGDSGIDISNRIRTVRWVIERLKESQNVVEQAKEVAAAASPQPDSDN